MSINKAVKNWEVEKRVMDKRKDGSMGADVNACDAGVRATTVMVTPEKAESWLRRGGKNRKLIQTQVDRLAKEMLAGRWALDGQTVIFDNQGRLLNGQHRLNAVIQSGCTVLMLVVSGVHDPNAFSTIDTNQTRRGAHTILDIEKIANPANVAAIAKRLLHWENAHDKTRYSFTVDAWRKIPQADVVAYGIRNNDEIQSMFREIKQALPYRRCKAGSALVTALIICNRADEVTTLVFNEGLKTGANLPEKSSVALLRDRLIAPPERRGIGWELELMALTIKAWNYFWAGKPMKVLRVIQEGPAAERFPVPGRLS